MKHKLGLILPLFFVLLACGAEKYPTGSTPAFYSESFYSRCKEGFGKIAATAGPGKVMVSSFDGTIKVEHVDAYYNCCASISMEVRQVGSRFDVFEKDEGDSCDCMCYTDVTAFICNLSPGTYLVRVFDIRGNVIAQRDVTVQGKDDDFPR